MALESGGDRQVNESKFKIGAAVATYDINIRGTGIIVEIKGDLIGINPDDAKTVFQWFHKKQCRLLRKKKRKHMWVTPEIYTAETSSIDGRRLHSYSWSFVNGWHEFVEVRKETT